MPRFTIKTPDGSQVDVDAPEGASENDALAFVASTWKPAAAAAPAVAGPGAAPDEPVAPTPSIRNTDTADLIAGHPAVRAAVGVASPLIGAFQLGANAGDWISEKMGFDPVVGQWTADRIKAYEEMKRRGMAGWAGEQDGGVDVAGLGGTMASGAGMVSRVAPAVTWGGRVAQGTGIGIGMGAVAPSATPGLEETGKNMLIGGVIGGGIPAVAPTIKATAQGIYRLGIEPYIDSASIKGRNYLTAAGDKVTEILNNLKNAQEIVPGSMPTAGQAASPAGRAEFSALQKTAADVAPTPYLARTDAQNKARVKQIDTVAGTEAEQNAARATRKANADVNYPAAYAEGIDQDMAKALAPQIKEILKRPSVQQARRDAATSAKEEGKVFAKMGDAESLDYVRKTIGKQIAAEKDPNARRILIQTQEDLTHIMEQVAPGLGKARAAYKSDSAVVNQHDVGQYLKDKLVPALAEEGPQKATSFAGAVRDAPGTLKRSLDGNPRYQKLTDFLTPEQNAAVESIKEDLAREARDKLMAQKGRQAGPNALNVASTAMKDATGGDKLVNPLSRIVTIANAVIDRLGNRIDKKLAIQIAEEMLNPKAVAASMERTMRRQEVAKNIATTTNKLIAPTMYTGMTTANNLNYE